MAVRAVQGTVLDTTGKPIVGTPVICQLSVPFATTTSGFVSGAALEQLTDGTGTYSLSLYAQADLLTPLGAPLVTTYNLTIAGDVIKIVVPSGAYNGARPTYFDVNLDGLIQ